MTFSLLSTKLYIPPVRAGVIARPRLMEKLRAGVQQSGSFILLSGPAGFGKTTLLSEFASQYEHSVAWLSLEEGESDPNRFWTYLILACQIVLKGVGESALMLLRTPSPIPEDRIATLLINDLAEQEQPVILILDDFHTLQNASIHTSFLFLLDHLPPNLHILLSTRTDPPWPLARYRARNQLVEIRAQDLRFTQEEATKFLNLTMGLSLSAEAVAALGDRTEGWIAGLQLAALSMEGRSDRSAFIQALTGSHVYIAEYLIDEVLQQQTEEMQAFLLQTAILDRLNAALCQAVTGNSDSQSKLTHLLRSNIFISPLDDEGQWFRYHHLFADLLKARLQSSASKTVISELHQRAAEWFEQNGMIAEAVEHGLAAGNYAQGVRLVEQHALPMILQAYVRTVEGWLQAIPVAFVEKSPKINLAYAWMNLLRGLPLQAVPFISRLQAMFSEAEVNSLNPSLQVEWLAVQSEFLIAQGHPEESRDLAIQAQKMLPEVDPTIRSMVYVTLAKAYQQTFDYERASEVFQMIVQDARRAGEMIFEVLGTSGQAQMILKQGRLHRTYSLVSECIQRLEALGKELPGSSLPFSATLYGELGQVYFEWHQFNRAQEYLRRAMEISGKSGYSDPEIYYHLILSEICQMEGDLEGSVREMQQASDLASLSPPVMIRESVIAQQVKVDLAQDHCPLAEQRLAVEGFRFEETFHFPEFAPTSPITQEAGLLYNSALRVLLYQAQKQPRPGKVKDGIDLAERLLVGELRSQHLSSALETLLLLSQLYAVSGNHSKCLAVMAEAIRLAEPEGFISKFVEEGLPTADILAELLKSGTLGKEQSAYVRQLLAAFFHPAHSREEPNRLVLSSQAAEELAEPLSARELEVLQLIANGDSNQMIAEKLFITISAVKKHSGNIYGKLSVNSRTQAVLRARQLGLLAPDP